MINGKVTLVPRAVLEHTLGRALKEGMLTRHLCGNHLCCNPAHLREGTPAENHADMMRHGRYTPYRGGPLFLVTRLMHGIDFRGDNECWPWMNATDEAGYGRLRREGKNATAHRIMLEIALERPLGGDECALHSCDNPPCCNPAHLRVGSRAENLREAAARSRMPKGERSALSRVAETAVVKMRERYSQGGVTCDELGAEYGLSHKAVWYIVSGETWEHAGGPITRGLTNKPKGEQNKNARMTAAKVRDIRELHVLGKTMEELAQMYDIDPTTVSQIVTGKTWKEVEGPLVKRRSPMTAADAKRIREQFAAGGITGKQLAEQEGCDTTTISLLLHGHQWKNAGGPILPPGYQDRSGARNSAAKLTWEQVREIRRRYTGARGEQSALAREFGVHQAVIWSIVMGKTWKDAGGPIGIRKAR